MAERWEWVEIIEPRTKEHMYANLTTGECVWDPPPGVKIKHTDDNQWWELFDPHTSRFYYYNASSQKTVWHRPQNCDIIPLAKLQTLKQNTEVRDGTDEAFPPPKREISTQTPLPTQRREHHVRTGSLKETSTQPYTSPHPGRKQRYSRQDSGSSHSSSGHHDSFKEHRISTERLSAEQIRRRGSHTGSHSSQSTTPGYSSSPSFQTGLARRESFEIAPRSLESPRLHRTHSAVHRSESTHSGGLPARSASYRYVGMREDSPVYSRDDSYLYQGHGHYGRGSSYHRGSGSDREYVYASRSETYTPPFRHDSFTPPPLHSCEGSLHDSIHSREGSYHDQHEHVYSPASVQSSHSQASSSGYRQDNLYSPVLHLSKQEPDRTSNYSPISGNQTPTRELSSERVYSPIIVGTKDECLAFSQDIVCQQQGGHSSPASSKPKLRFPRTNPTYVGVNRRDGNTAYKKINVDQQELLESGVSDSAVNTAAMQTSQIHPEYFDTSYYRQEKSDSDGSYSSSRIFQQDRKDSQASHSSLRNRDLSDSQSSQGSTRNMSDVQSEGSLRNMQDSAVSFQESISSRGSNKSFSVDKDSLERININNQQFSVINDNQVGEILEKEQYLEDEDSEPEYANLPSDNSPTMKIKDIISENKLTSTTTSAIPEFIRNNIEENNLKNVLKERNSNDSYSEEVRNGDTFLNYDFQSSINGTGHDDDENHVMLDLMQSSQYSEDQGFEDTENSNMYSLSHQYHTTTMPSSQVSIETQHSSLKRKKQQEKREVTQDSPVMEKSHSLQVDLSHRPLSLVVPSQSEANMPVSPSIGSLSRQGRAGTCPPIGSSKNLSSKQKLPSDSDIENYAHQHLNKHKKGLFGKNVPITNMLKWTKDPITKPMLRTNDKNVKKEAIEVFKLIQMYMGDRKTKLTQSCIALEIAAKGWTLGADLRDEIYIQICRQTTENKKEDSLQRGWELMAILLNFFPPTHKFYSYLEGYISRHIDPQYDLENFSLAKWCNRHGIRYTDIIDDEHYNHVPIHHFAEHCQRRLEKSMQSGAKRGVRKPSMDEIEQAKKSIYCPSMFGSSLQDIMKMQLDHYQDRRLPWIQTSLSEWVLRLNGAKTEGIFRVPGDIDEVNTLKIHCDQWKPPTECSDPHVPASLLKLWYRELEHPLIPNEFYGDCIENYTDPEAAVDVVNKLPEINRLVLAYLIRFLQVFAAEDNAHTTKMDVNNLAMVMAPNCLRCESQDPRIIFENTRKEMGFIRTLIQNLDTSFMQGIE